MIEARTSGLVGLVGFGGFSSDNSRAQFCSPNLEATPSSDSHLVGLVGFGGFSADNSRTEFRGSNPEASPSSDPALVGLVGSGGFVPANGATKICPDADSPVPGLVGLVPIGGLLAANRPSTFCTDAALSDSDKALAKAARGILRTLEDAGLTLAVTDAGALQVSPASALRIDQRLAIREHREGLVALVRLRGALFVDDYRHRCIDCVHLQRKGTCAVAQRGQMPGVNPWFTPAPQVLQHCHFFHPHAVELGAP